MAEIEESQRRIAAALSRIDAGLEALQAQGAGDAQAQENAEQQAQDVAALTSALEEEKLVSAQLEERIKGLKARHATELEEARAAAESAGTADAAPAVVAIDAELQKLKKAVAQLREANSALREANEAGLSEPHLINKAMLAELEALRAERAAEVAETSAILSALEPLLSGGGSDGPAAEREGA
jgi:chromosome segregation ATPase